MVDSIRGKICMLHVYTGASKWGEGGGGGGRDFKNMIISVVRHCKTNMYINF